jgi:hypothetical protein
VFLVSSIIAVVDEGTGDEWGDDGVGGDSRIDGEDAGEGIVFTPKRGLHMELGQRKLKWAVQGVGPKLRMGYIIEF